MKHDLNNLTEHLPSNQIAAQLRGDLPNEHGSYSRLGLIAADEMDRLNARVEELETQVNDAMQGEADAVAHYRASVAELEGRWTQVSRLCADTARDRDRLLEALRSIEGLPRLTAFRTDVKTWIDMQTIAKNALAGATDETTVGPCAAINPKSGAQCTRESGHPGAHQRGLGSWREPQ